MKYQVFISYRRATGRDIARNICDRLRTKGYEVFFDFDSMRNGQFDRRIYSAIDDASDFILILSKDSMDRCSSPVDWVRMEITHALEQNKNIVLVQDESFTCFPADFPAELQPVTRIDFTPINQKYYNSFIKELENRLVAKPRYKAARFWNKTGAILKRYRKPLIALLVAVIGISTGVCLYQNRQIRFDEYQYVSDDNLDEYRIEVPKKLINIYESSGIDETDFGESIDFSLYYKDPFSNFQVFIFDEDVSEYPALTEIDDYVRSSCNNLESTGQEIVRIKDENFNGQPAKWVEYTNKQYYYRKLVFPLKDADDLYYVHVCVASDYSDRRRYRDAADRIIRSIRTDDMPRPEQTGSDVNYWKKGTSPGVDTIAVATGSAYTVEIAGIDSLAADSLAPEIIDEDKIYETVQEPPMFRGGEDAMFKWLDDHLQYPAKEKEAGITGRVMVRFVVMKDGSVSDVKVTRSVHEALDNEAVRLIKNMPPLYPGKQNNRPVNTFMTIPVPFSLNK